MFDIVCVTDRALCEGEFLTRIEEIAACRPKRIILREKDLSEEDYTALAGQVWEICKGFGTELVLHSFTGAAERLGIWKIHLPLHMLRSLDGETKQRFELIGASCHSADEAEEAVSLGAQYIVAGHIFETDCKKGLAGRGLTFLREVCERVEVPVYAIGGITPDNMKTVAAAGAAGCCIMSGFMKAPDVRGLFERSRGE